MLGYDKNFNYLHSGYFFSIFCRLLIFLNFLANLLGNDKNLNEIINIPFTICILDLKKKIVVC